MSRAGWIAAGAAVVLLGLLVRPRPRPPYGTVPWYDPSYDDSQWTHNAVGPGPGNQPNGIWFTRIAFPVAMSGVYTISVSVDDAAAVYFNGIELGVVVIGQTQTFHVSIDTQRGFIAVFAAEVVNNDMGTAQIVPNGSGSPNPTALNVTITDPAGNVIVSSANPQGWNTLAYPAVPPPGAQTQGQLT